ncbi:exonuclease domain-containing protein [uncultured Aquitalea sp.]|uniref:exonuclease domain-containing protein n=1 Tax=uncultured Aquitalea sp. TaxID=540272 RepID=UPI0025EB2D88|nr:exonuclease domain-containing protein [uncultured Aquitalea sp.]
MLFDIPWAIVDLETTGGHIGRDRITEIGLLLLDGERVERYQTLVNPGKTIPPFIQDMTGISNEMVSGAPSFAALAEALLDKLKGRLLVAHNARFDYGFLRNEFRRVGMRLQADSLCTVKLSRKLYPQHYKHNLDSIIERHGLVLPERHRAMADAEALYGFLQSAMAELGDAAVRSGIEAVQAMPELPPGVDARLVEDLPDLPGVYAVYGQEGQALFVGRGGNVRAKVVSQLAQDGKQGKEPAIRLPISRIDCHETVGELQAQLLENQLVRELQPFYNHRARLATDLCSIQLDMVGDAFVRPRVVMADQLDFSRTAELYGLFRSPKEARRVLADLASANSLCAAVLGVEQVTSRKGAGCSALKQGRCRGACVGHEEPMTHNVRLLQALGRIKVKAWPYAGPVAIIERDEVTGDAVEHQFDRWCYLGSRIDGATGLQGTPRFDLDTYKLLEGWLKKPAEGSELHLL